MGNKNTLIFILFFSLVLTACSFKKQDINTNFNNTNIDKCTDQECFLPKFISCSLSELIVPFADDANNVMAVQGWQDNNCVFEIKLVNSLGQTPEGKLVCKVPKEKISEKFVKNWLGEYQDDSMRDIRVEQTKIWNDYCVRQPNQ